MDRELLIVAAAVALVFALPVAMLCWIAVQWAFARATERRLEALEAAVRRLGPGPVAGAAAGGIEAVAGDADAPDAVEVPRIAVAGEVPPTEEKAIERLDDDFDAAALTPRDRP